MREISTIVGLEVIGIADGKVLGRVSEVVCDLASGRLVGLILGQGPAEKGIAADAIITIGDDAVMVPSSEVAQPLSQMEELMKYRRPEGKALEVVTDDGRRIGRVVRIWIDPYEKVVTRYEVSRGVVQDVTEGRIMLPIMDGTIHGSDTIIVPAAQTMELAGHAGGLRDALRKLSQRVKEQSAAAREKAEEAARVARERLQQAVEAAKQQAEVRGQPETESSKPPEATEGAAEQETPEQQPEQQPVGEEGEQQSADTDEAASEEPRVTGEEAEGQVPQELAPSVSEEGERQEEGQAGGGCEAEPGDGESESGPKSWL